MKLFVKLLLIFPFVHIQIFPQLNTPNWAYDAVIYEVNIRQYTKEGTFKAFQNHLPQLKEMGVGIIWLMPINPIGEKTEKVRLVVIIL